MKYVIVGFSDGDYRVYTKRVANTHKLREYDKRVNIRPEKVAEGENKYALLSMARIAREAFIVEWPNETDLVDRTDEDTFP